MKVEREPMNLPPPRHGRGCGLMVGLCALAIALLCSAAVAAVDDARALSARLSDEAFALLSSLSNGNRDHPSPLLGPIGVFAADSQKLSSALQSSDRRGASAVLASLKSDAAAVDSAAASGGLDASKWAAAKHDLEQLSALIPAAPAGALPAAASAEPGPSTAPAASSEPRSGPTVRIESAEMVGPDVLRIKGYMSAHGIRSAGIYLSGSRLARLNVKPTPGEQTVRFDLQIHNPQQGSVLRVYDSAGRSAQAPIMGEAAAAGPIIERGTPVAPMPAPSLDSDENVALGGGSDDFSSGMKAMLNPPASAPVESNPSAEGASVDNTKEIPAATPPPSGPRRRMRSHLRARGPNDIHIQLDDLTVVDPGMHQYMVRGQITGSDLERAGIYVDGRLAQEIALNSGSGLRTSNFAQSFTANGSEATIRVYRTRRDYTESSLNLATAAVGSGAAAPAIINSTIGGAYGGYGALNPGQLAVQITSVQAAAPSLYVVSGIITGQNIASAGIYQNGMLVQPLNINGGGIGGLITGLIPGMNRQVSFVGRFNPAMGYATVRAYNTAGLMAEQPIIAGGTGYGINPYGAMNPYTTNPYGVAPYGAAPPGYGAPGVGMAPGVGASPRTSGGLGSVPW